MNRAVSAAQTFLRLVFGQSDIVNLRTGWCLVPEQLPTYSAYATVVSTLPLPPVASTPPPISSSNAAILFESSSSLRLASTAACPPLIPRRRDRRAGRTKLLERGRTPCSCGRLCRRLGSDALRPLERELLELLLCLIDLLLYPWRQRAVAPHTAPPADPPTAALLHLLGPAYRLRELPLARVQSGLVPIAGALIHIQLRLQKLHLLR